jgi:hypothetical protein
VVEVEREAMAQEVVGAVGADVDGDVPRLSSDVETAMLMILRFVLEPYGLRCRAADDLGF